MNPKIISKKEAFYHNHEGVKGWYYQLPEFENGHSVIYAEIKGKHGLRKIGKRGRIYSILSGKGKYTINNNNKKFKVKSGDLIVIPTNSTYCYESTISILKVILFMDLLDLTKLPK